MKAIKEILAREGGEIAQSIDALQDISLDEFFEEDAAEGRPIRSVAKSTIRTAALMYAATILAERMVIDRQSLDSEDETFLRRYAHTMVMQAGGNLTTTAILIATMAIESGQPIPPVIENICRHEMFFAFKWMFLGIHPSESGYVNPLLMNAYNSIDNAKTGKDAAFAFANAFGDYPVIFAARIAGTNTLAKLVTDKTSGDLNEKLPIAAYAEKNWLNVLWKKSAKWRSAITVTPKGWVVSTPR